MSANNWYQTKGGRDLGVCGASNGAPARLRVREDEQSASWTSWRAGEAVREESLQERMGTAGRRGVLADGQGAMCARHAVPATAVEMQPQGFVHPGASNGETGIQGQLLGRLSV